MNKTYRNRLAFNMRHLAACLLLILGFACCESQQPNYVITGSIPGAKNGDVVYLEEIQNMEVTKLDSAVVRNGHFTFKGYQDSTVLRYLSCITENEAFSFPFFLESGELQAKIVSGNESVTGTLHNNIFQKIRTQSFKLLKQMDYIEKDSTLNKQQKEVQIDATERAYAHIQKRGMRDNITNPVGIYLFKMNYYENSLTENLELFKRIPSKYLNDIELRGIGKQLEAQKKTAVNTPFTDLTLQTPDGKPGKLSDYIGKGKPVVVDFWASWCAPCRQAMPDLVKLYKKYQGKIEIIGISLDENQESWKEAIQRLGITWPQLSDLKGWKSSAAHTYGIHTIPHLLLIDPSGTIIARNISHDEIAAYLKNWQ